MSKTKVRRRKKCPICAKPRSTPMVMHKDVKGRDFRARMKWLLDFLNTNIDSLNPVECLKLFFDFMVFMDGSPPPCIGFPETYFKQVSNLGELIKDRERKFLNTGQGLFRRMLERILMTSQQIDQGSDDTLPLHRFDTYIMHYQVVMIKDRVFKNRQLYLDNEDEEIMKFYENKGLFVDALIEVLSRFPLSRIKTCQKPDCGKYFFQKTSKSKGDFCSPKCQNWARTNRWRKANPDKYNAYHRNRRARAKEDQVEVKCSACRFRQSLGPIGEMIRGVLSDMQKCPTCGKMLLHFIRTWESGKWAEGELLGSFEWEEFFRNQTQKGGNNNG